jgi:hypothetical protein
MAYDTLLPDTLVAVAIGLATFAIALFLTIALFVSVAIPFATFAIALFVACHIEAWAARCWRQGGGVIIKCAIYWAGKRVMLNILL